MNVGEIMQRNVMTVVETDGLEQVLRHMLAHGVRHAPVMRDGQLVGVISERNLLGHRARYNRDDQVGRIMTTPPFVVEPETSVASASALMSTHKIGCLPVLRDGQLVGIVTRTDLLTVLAHERVPRTWQALSVADVMQDSPITAHANESLAYAALKMLQNGVRHLPVVDVANRAVGVLSDRDLRSAIGDPALLVDANQAPLRLDQRTVGDVMSRMPAVVRPSDPLTHVAERLSEEQLGALLVIDREMRLVGIVSYVDVLQAMLDAA